MPQNKVNPFSGPTQITYNPETGLGQINNISNKLKLTPLTGSKTVVSKFMM